MSEQGTGGIDGVGVGHTRANSDADAVPTTEPTVDSRTPATQAPSEDDAEYAQAARPFKQPRHLEERSGVASRPHDHVLLVSRNPSSSSTRSAIYARGDSPYTRGGSSSSIRASHRPLEPPVTKSTLSELDVNKIIHNPKLRHDINFDPELHFRPNLDGEKGRKKQEKANLFWASLRDQLVLFVTDREAFTERYGSDAEWCLPRLLKAVKEIIQTLVPARDRDFLNEGLNVDLLIQQFNRGIADLEKLASWLSSVLKLHCAPMRDEWVDEMYQELSNGNRTNDIGELVKGMRSLLGVLEAMKLDVANHQIRCLRPMLIEDTVHFQQRFFQKKLQTGRLDMDSAKRWYRKATLEYSMLNTEPEAQQALGDMAEFFYGLSNLVLPSSSILIPSTLIFDEDRLLKLRSDAVDAICLDICMKQYEDLERVSKVTQMMSASSSLLPPTSIPSYVLEDEVSLRSRSNRSSIEFNFNAPPSRPSSLALSACGSTSSSPRSSACIFTPSASPSSVASDAADARTKSAKMYASLVDLLQTSLPASGAAQKWRSLVPDVAVQILRFTGAPYDMLQLIESRLEAQLSDFESENFREAQQSFHSRLFGELASRVGEYKNLSGLGLFSAATGSRLHNGTSGSPGAASREGSGQQFLQVDRDSGHRSSSRQGAREEHGVEDMATRLAHLGLLHWRVWSDMAYRSTHNEMDESAEFAML